MAPERWRRIEELYHSALARSIDERAAFLAQACAGDEQLQREVESLLAQGGSKEDVLDRGAIAAAVQQVNDPSVAPLTGRRIGVYQILAPLGAGGMGEVYRARDTKLGREVAIKILPPAFTSHPERLARFEREARVLAALNHPHIAAIHGVEESDGIHAFVLELVEGETLAERIAHSGRRAGLSGAAGLPAQEALDVARQIADALDAAHEKGIVHRDLKPANIKISPDGVVKVLDFGLAKLDLHGGGGGETKSPTITIGGTHDGLIVGTVAYMSPEQARGQAVDKRTDIWAFGCVLYEMLTGRTAFAADTISDTIAAVLERDPDWRALPANTPTLIRRLLRRCLEKDRKRRLADISDARLDLDLDEASKDVDLDRSRDVIERASQLAPRNWRRPWLWVVTALGCLVVGVAVWSATRTPPAPARAIAQLAVPLPTVERPVIGELRHTLFAISADGSRLVYGGDRLGVTQLYQRAFDERDFKPIPGTEGGERPFFSPDGRWVGFSANRALKKVSIGGGAPVELVTGVDIQSATWGANDEIIFALNSGAGLWRVSAGGGAPRALTTLDPRKDEAAHAWPEVLPGGQAVLFSVRPASGSWDDAQIVVVSLDTGEHRVLIRGGSQAKYASSGHLVYASGGTLMAAPFDLRGLAVTGPPVAILQGLSFHRGQEAHAAQFAFAEAGSLVYLTGPEASNLAKLVWVDRAGRSQPLAAAPRVYQWPRLSPDGQKIAVVIQDPSDTDLWVFDVMRETSSRVTFHEQTDFPIWMPDGKRLTYHSLGRGNTNLVSKAADGSGIEEQLMTGPHQRAAESWSPDGGALVFQELAESQDLWILPMDGDRKPRPFLRTPFEEGWARLSPDGRWLAYVSNESGRNEVYVLPYPGPGAKRQLSNDGGAEPVWARDGRELFYRAGDKMMVVEVSMSPSFTAGKPRVLFERPYIRISSTPNYDVTRDGRFLMLEAVDQQAAPTQLNVVLNWTEDLKRRVPTK